GGFTDAQQAVVSLFSQRAFARIRDHHMGLITQGMQRFHHPHTVNGTGSAADTHNHTPASVHTMYAARSMSSTPGTDFLANSSSRPQGKVASIARRPQ